jgi:hypothetical protein
MISFLKKNDIIYYAILLFRPCARLPILLNCGRGDDGLRGDVANACCVSRVVGDLVNPADPLRTAKPQPVLAYA